MEHIYREFADRTLKHERADGSSYCDYFQIEVNLFKEMLVALKPAINLYVLITDTTSYVGDPDDPKQERATTHGIERQTIKIFRGGPDAKHIRRAIAIIDGFKEPK